MDIKDAIVRLSEAAVIIEREAKEATGDDRDAVLDILDKIDELTNDLEELTE